MLRRILRLKDAIISYLSQDEEVKIQFSPTEWNMMQAAADILLPFYRATVLLSGNKISSSQIILIVYKVKMDLEKNKAEGVMSM